MRTSVAQSVEERGVYWAKFRLGGLPVAYAVNGRGDVVRSLRVRPEWSVDAVGDYLWRILDERDPVPRLQLVKSEPTEPEPPKFDLRNALDAFTEERMKRDPRYRARVNRYLAQLAATPRARI